MLVLKIEKAGRAQDASRQINLAERRPKTQTAIAQFQDRKRGHSPVEGRYP